MTPLVTLLGLASVLAGFVLTALARAKKLGDNWEDRGLWAIFGGFGLIMAGVGLVLDRLRRLPNTGETVQVGSWRLEVLAVEHRAITRLRLLPYRPRNPATAIPPNRKAIAPQPFRRAPTPDAHAASAIQPPEDATTRPVQPFPYAEAKQP